MKKIFFIFIAQLAINCLSAQSCLPDGITFTTQVQIDNFQANYPNCSEISGYVRIDDNVTGGITNLNGLSVLNTIGGYLEIESNSALISLEGLHNVTSIGGHLDIEDNFALASLMGLRNLSTITGSLKITDANDMISLEGLENLTSVGNFLTVAFNETLTSLNGLENINPGTITVLYIIENYLLSSCDTKNICNYLVGQMGSCTIQSNAQGCNSKEEIIAECQLGLNESQALENYFNIYPNPNNGIFECQFSLFESQNVKIMINNLQGQELEMIMDEKLPSGAHSVRFDLSYLHSGIYIAKIIKNNVVEINRIVIN